MRAAGDKRGVLGPVNQLSASSSTIACDLPGHNRFQHRIKRRSATRLLSFATAPPVNETRRDALLFGARIAQVSISAVRIVSGAASER